MNKGNVNRSLNQAAILKMNVDADTDEVSVKECWQTKNLKTIKINVVKRQVLIS